MAQPDISSILAALGAHVPLRIVDSMLTYDIAQNQQSATPQAPTPQQPPPSSYGAPVGYPPPGQPPSAPPQASSYLPQPSSTGSVDLSSIRPVNSGSVSIADAIAKAKSIAANKGVQSYDPRSGSASGKLSCDAKLNYVLILFSNTTRRP